MYWRIWKSIKIVDIISISDINILQVVSLEETLENTPNSDPKERNAMKHDAIRQMGVMHILVLGVLLVAIEAIVICNTEGDKLCHELGTIMNYTKCQGQFEDYTNRTFELPNDVTMLNLSAIGITPHASDQLIHLCDLEQLSYLDISQNDVVDIGVIPCSIPSLNVLVLSKNAITGINKDSFVGITNLTNLYLKGNYITVIESNSFSDLNNLRTLDLSDNNLLGIQSDILRGLTNLKYINLANNKISFILVGAFSGLGSLESIDLSWNGLSTIDKLTFVGAERLQQLILKGNPLTGSSFEFLTIFRHLFYVDLSKIAIQTLESGSFYQINVSHIVLSKNENFKVILEKSFSSCPLLESIDISNNPLLFYIHSKAFRLNNLKTINVSRSGLEYFYQESLQNETLVTLYETHLQCNCLNNNILSSTFQTRGLNLNSCLNDSLHQSFYESSNKSINIDYCPPNIISKLKREYIMSVGQRLTLGCFGVGVPWPDLKWIRTMWNGSQTINETITTDYWLQLHIIAINQGEKYGCVANATGMEDSQFFTLTVKNTDVGVVILRRASTFIVISWNKTHAGSHHVVMYREYEKTLDYHVKRVHDYWKVFKISNLKAETAYEVCIGSALDINDRNCVKTSTTFKSGMAGIHTDIGVLIVLIIAGLTFGVCFLTTLYKCIKIVKGSTKPEYIVHSLSHDSFSEVKDATYTYENHFTDFVITENEAKTEL